MSLTFEGETLNIGGFEITGTVVIQPEISDGSFCHEFGTEDIANLNFLPWGFVPDLGDLKLNNKLVERAVSDWIDRHERQIMAAYERAVKKG